MVARGLPCKEREGRGDGVSNLPSRSRGGTGRRRLGRLRSMLWRPGELEGRLAGVEASDDAAGHHVGAVLEGTCAFAEVLDPCIEVIAPLRQQGVAVVDLEVLVIDFQFAERRQATKAVRVRRVG